ncbi:hypothetical protein [Georgenia alba]|uniref:Sulfotransferase family protein n=1 Tax=Georgenia alba TaxID=2233858 RepID=A0ABW2Q757_9MICO
MAERVVLHVGAPKTGTTFLQAVLFQNQGRLREQGVLVPGKLPRFHARAATGVRLGPDSAQHQAWRGVLDQSREWPGTVLVSGEWFSMASEARTAEAMRDLHGVGEVHVVATARDLVDQVPAAWQETLKLGDSSSIDAFSAGLDRPDGRWRWSVLDVAPVLDRWAATLPPRQAHVVTVPPRGSAPELLWNRFASACGIDPSWCSTDVSFARESLGVDAARLLQLAGPRLRAAIDADNSGWHEPYRWIQRYLSHGMLLRHRGGRITMSSEQVASVRERSERSVAQLRERGYDVVGDLADLTSSRLPDGAVHPESIPDGDVLDVALHLVADMLAEARRTAPARQA